jgi:hypothetical protein
MPEFWLIGVAVLVNLILAVAGFYLAWRLWRWRQELMALTALLEHWHGQLHQGVKAALIEPSQGRLAYLKYTYGRLSQQLQMGAQVLTWVGLGWRLGWGWWGANQARGKVTYRRHHRRHEKR